jgi:hypothetical protein
MSLLTLNAMTRGPLCEFLGKPVPDEPFPHGNKSGGQFEENMKEGTKDILASACRNMAISLATLVIAGGGLWYKFS